MNAPARAGTAPSGKQDQPASIPGWPRRSARIFGSLGLAGLAIVIMANLFTYFGIGQPVEPEHTFADSLFFATTVGAMIVIAIGLVLAFWREGAGALVILTGGTLMMFATLGIGLIAAAPAFLLGGLYAISWTLHHTDDGGSSVDQRLSRWIRSVFYRHVA